jgi:hypothetical protein
MIMFGAASCHHEEVPAEGCCAHCGLLLVQLAAVECS